MHHEPSIVVLLHCQWSCSHHKTSGKWYLQICGKWCYTKIGPKESIYSIALIVHYKNIEHTSQGTYRPSRFAHLPVGEVCASFQNCALHHEHFNPEMAQKYLILVRYDGLGIPSNLAISVEKKVCPHAWFCIYDKEVQTVNHHHNRIITSSFGKPLTKSVEKSFQIWSGMSRS